MAGVLGRTRRARAAGPGDEKSGTRTFTIALAQRDGASEGRLVVRTPDGGETEREVTGDTCEEVVSALALIVALTIDPHASTSSAVAPPPAPPPADPPAPPPAEPAASPPVPAPPADVAPARPPREPRWRFSVSAEASAAAGIAPRWVIGVPLAVHAQSPSRGLLSPSFHLGVQRASSGSIDVDAHGATAAFDWTVGTADACPGRVRYAAFSAEPCLRFEAGTLHGAGGAIAPAREATRAWVALGALGRASFSLAPPLFVALESGLHLPLTRTTYYFEPNTTIYRAPAVGGFVGAGVGARFL
jgi:hypothetical protein